MAIGRNRRLKMSTMVAFIGTIGVIAGVVLLTECSGRDSACSPSKKEDNFSAGLSFLILGLFSCVGGLCNSYHGFFQPPARVVPDIIDIHTIAPHMPAIIDNVAIDLDIRIRFGLI